MRRKFWTLLALVLVVPGLLLLAGCPPKDGPGPDETPTDTGTVDTTRPVDTGSTDDDVNRPTPTPRPSDDSTGELYGDLVNTPDGKKFENEDILFEFDSSALSSEAQGILKDKANFMNKYKNSSIVVEGHCDERGTNEYNLALGDRRAESVKSFLLKLGIPASRIKTISYGEERPFDQGHDEGAWAKNRRAHFVLQK